MGDPGEQCNHTTGTEVAGKYRKPNQRNEYSSATMEGRHEVRNQPEYSIGNANGKKPSMHDQENQQPHPYAHSSTTTAL